MTTNDLTMVPANEASIARASDPPVGPAPTSRRVPSATWIDMWVLAVLPVVILVVLGVSPYFRLNNGDPFIYVGYSNAFETHVARFGYTYHSVRFGLIFPLRASLILGPFWGYFILRYLLYMLVVVPMWAVLRPQGRRIALLGPVIFISSPIAAQAILTTHPDTIVVPFVSVTTCMLVLAVRTKSLSRLSMFAAGAGLAAGVSVNANIFSAPLLALLTLTVCGVLAAQRRYRGALVAGALVLIGTVTISVAGMLAYKAMFGDANIYRTTWNAARDVSNDNVWRTPSLEWMSTRRYTYAPVIALILGAAALIRAKRPLRLDPERIVIFACAAVAVGYFMVDQFVRKGTSIEQAYYYSFLVGPICLLTADAIGWNDEGGRVRTWAALALPVVLAYVSQVVEIRRFVVFLVILGFLLIVVVRSRTSFAGVAALLCMHLAWGASPRTISAIDGAGFQYEPHYEQVFGNRDPTAFDAYLLASRLPSLIPSEPGRVVPLYFWYRTGDAMLDSVQASYHWEALTVQQSPGPGMPSLSNGDLDRLRLLVGGYVVLLGEERSELDTGIAALLEQGFTIDAGIPPVELTEGDSTVLVQVVPVIAAPPPAG